MLAVHGASTSYIRQYGMTTAFDISTMTYIGSKIHTTPDTQPYGLYASDECSYYFTAGSSTTNTFRFTFGA